VGLMAGRLHTVVSSTRGNARPPARVQFLLDSHMIYVWLMGFKVELTELVFRDCQNIRTCGFVTSFHRCSIDVLSTVEFTK
jgi:hypothetical protein